MAREGKEEDLRSLPHQIYEQLISTLPLSKGWGASSYRNYQGFWYPEVYLPGAIAFRDNFKPCTTDLLLISPPKSGTTWLKALAFATVSRKDHHPSAPNHPLLRLHPHDCVPFAEGIFGCGQASKLDALPPPRLLATHMAYSLLPESVTSSDCRIVYICRDPKDTLVSTWHFMREMTPDAMEPLPFNEAFEMFCNGISSFGPVWDHYLGYWRESLRRPRNVLFLKYEEMMEDPTGNLRRLAEFVGCPFSPKEEREGVVEEIVRLCSFEKLSNTEVNKKGDRGLKEIVVKNSSFFRKGKAGDWKNYLTTEMARRLDAITEEKLRGSGLSFDSVEY